MTAGTVDMRCKDCKYWGEVNDQVKELRACDRALLLWNCTEWTEDYDEKIIRALVTDRKFFVQDGSDYQAFLYTKENFGCVEFEKRERGTVA